MNHNEVIKYPVLSEKTYAQMANHVYTFVVDFRTNKAQVKQVVEYIFDVKVEKVNIMTVQKKPKKLVKFQGFTNRFKKAVVTLKDGQKINIFPDEVAAESKKDAKKEKAEVKEMSAAEKKAAHKIAEKLKNKKATNKEIKNKEDENKLVIKDDVKKSEDKDTTIVNAEVEKDDQ